MTAGAICVRTSRLFWSFLPCRFLSCAAALLSLSSSSSSSCCCCCSCCLRLLSSLRRRTTPTSSLSPPLAAAILASDSGDDLSLLLLLLAACINPTPHKQLCDAGEEDAMTVVASPSSLMPATTYPPRPLLPALGKASARHNTHQKKQSAPLLTTLQRFFPLFLLLLLFSFSFFYPLPWAVSWRLNKIESVKISFSFSPCLSLSLNSYNNSVATTKNRPDPIIKSSTPNPQTPSKKKTQTKNSSSSSCTSFSSFLLLRIDDRGKTKENPKTKHCCRYSRPRRSLNQTTFSFHSKTTSTTKPEQIPLVLLLIALLLFLLLLLLLHSTGLHTSNKCVHRRLANLQEEGMEKLQASEQDRESEGKEGRKGLMLCVRRKTQGR